MTDERHPVIAAREALERQVASKYPMRTDLFGSYACPWCRVEVPHQHFIDRKGYVRGFDDPDKVIGRIPYGDRAEDDPVFLRAYAERLRAGLERIRDATGGNGLPFANKWARGVAEETLGEE